jgi:hypothetical protein
VNLSIMSMKPISTIISFFTFVAFKFFYTTVNYFMLLETLSCRKYFDAYVALEFFVSYFVHFQKSFGYVFFTAILTFMVFLSKMILNTLFASELLFRTVIFIKL